MRRRRETRWEHVADTIRLVVLPSWKVIFALLLVLLLAFLFWLSANRPTVTQTAEIVRFGQHPSRIANAGTIAVTIKSSNGLISELLPLARDVADCQVGGRITYTTGPTGLRIDGCSHVAP